MFKKPANFLQILAGKWFLTTNESVELNMAKSRIVIIKSDFLQQYDKVVSCSYSVPDLLVKCVTNNLFRYLQDHK
jgi:hypothetical protein